jgi:hypothetical protein
MKYSNLICISQDIGFDHCALLAVREEAQLRTYVFFRSKRFQHFGLRLIETQKD